MKTDIILCCILGNEEDVIERFMRSFAPAVDAFHFVRAIGNAKPDSTFGKAESLAKQLGKPLSTADYLNQIPEWDHVDNFSCARQMSFTVPKRYKYLMWADADDVLGAGSAELIRAAAESGDKDVYIFPYEVRGKSQIVYRERLVRNDGCSFWDYPVHELLKFNREVSYHILKSATVIHSPLPHKKGSPGRNQRILEHAVQNGARHLFYLSQEHAWQGNRKAFSDYSKAALNHPGLDDLERYEILVNLAQNEPDGTNAKFLAAQAYNLMPDRREALALLACYALVDKRYYEALHLAKDMISKPKPNRTYWTLNHDWYTWKGLYLLTQCLRMAGKPGADELEEREFVKNGSKISLLHATRNRGEQALACRDLWLSRASNPMQVEHIFAYDDDEKDKELLRGYKHVEIPSGGGCVAAWNAAAAASKGSVLVQLSDDWEPPIGWDEIILNRFYDLEKSSVLALSDGHRQDRLLCMAILTRKRYEEQGYLFHPGFKSVYSDNWFTEKAYADHVVIEARDVAFYHHNPFFQLGHFNADSTYAESNTPARYSEGEALFLELVKSL